MQASRFPDNLKYQLSLKKFQLFLNNKLYINYLSNIILKIKVIIKVDQFLKIKINLVKFINSKIQDSQLKILIISNKVLIINNSKCTKIKMQAIKDNKIMIKIIFKIITKKISNNLTQKKISTQFKIPNIINIKTTFIKFILLTKKN
jgi:hypothetical protein